ncbi:MAG: MlaE family lipid ABC transporter permease subunit [Chitinivibrionales bacterium]|nr:MlaE family lipid ABC transporter permease subunit [Chitinivibrionales bacterium]
MNDTQTSAESRPATSASSAVELPERLDRAWVEQAHGSLGQSRGTLRLDFSATRHIDSAGISFIHTLKRRLDRKGRQLVLANVPRHIMKAIQSWHAPRVSREKPLPRVERFFVQIGDMALAAVENGTVALSVLAEMLYWGSFGMLRKRDFRKGIVGEQMYLLGYKAVLIVLLLTFLVGIVIALQSAMFLRTYGAGVYLASMIGWSMLKEFGPLFTAVILAGRTGSATTAEIATMVVSEEIDALKTMGISHYQFVVVPKFWAITVTMPLLSILASSAGIFGAYLVSLFYLDLASSLFWTELSKYIHFRDIFGGLFKAMVFSWLIIWIGTYSGLKVKGGAEAVGKETTASVVTCIFVIILADALFSFVI